MSCDTQGVVAIVLRFEVPSSYGLGVKVFGRYLDKRMTYSIIQYINDEGVCITAPATPGLFNWRD